MKTMITITEDLASGKVSFVFYYMCTGIKQYIYIPLYVCVYIIPYSGNVWHKKSLADPIKVLM